MVDLRIKKLSMVELARHVASQAQSERNGSWQKPEKILRRNGWARRNPSHTISDTLKPFKNHLKPIGRADQSQHLRCFRAKYRPGQQPGTSIARCQSYVGFGDFNSG